MKKDGMNPGISSTLRYKQSQITWGSVQRQILCWSGVGPGILHFWVLGVWFRNPTLKSKFFSVSPGLCLLWSQMVVWQLPGNILDTQAHLYWFYLKYSPARNNGSFPEPALLGEWRCLGSFQRLQKNDKKLAKEATAFKGAKFCWEQFQFFQINKEKRV